MSVPLLGLVASLLGCDVQGMIAGAPELATRPCEDGARGDRCTESPAFGVPPEACGAGFTPDGQGGCEPILPKEPCPPGQLAVPGDTVCHEIAPCGAAPYGDIPVDDTTQHVDQSFAGEGSDGTRERPWRTVQDGIDAAAPFAIVAVAADSPELLLAPDNIVSGNTERDRVTSGELPVPEIPPSIP